MIKIKDFTHKLKSWKHLVQHSNKQHSKVLLNKFHLKNYVHRLKCYIHLVQHNI